MTFEEFTEIEQIKRLKYRYMRALDTHDWALMRSCFTEDASTWLSGGKLSFNGVDNIIEMFEKVIPSYFVSSHVALHPEIDLTGPDTATAYWRLEDTVHYMEDCELPGYSIRAGAEIQGAGYYRDDYLKIDGEWKIKRTGYTRIYERTEAKGVRELVVNVDPALGVLERMKN